MKFKKKMKVNKIIDKYRTRLYIAYLISKLSRFISNSSIDHLKTIKKDTQIFEIYLILLYITLL